MNGCFDEWMGGWVSRRGKEGMKQKLGLLESFSKDRHLSVK
jgi:hypothetical protein